LSAPEVDGGRISDQFVGPYPKEQIEYSRSQDNFLAPKINPPSLDDAPKCSCVLFARWYLNREDIRGIAGAIKPSSQEPKIGSVVLLLEGELGHTAVVIGIEGDDLYLIEANYRSCQITTRQLKMDDKRIRGYL
jgi:hypothetical protein